MDPEISSAWIAAVASLTVACVSGLVAILGGLISYWAANRRLARELRAAEARLLQEHQLELARLEKDHQLQFARLKEEQLGSLRVGYHQKQQAAYTKFWELLAPLSDHRSPEQSLIRRETKPDGSHDAWLNAALSEAFFEQFRQFFYSELGIYLSKEARTAIFESREFILKTQHEGQAQPDGWVKIPNKQAKNIEQALDWVRKTIRGDMKLENWHLPDDLALDPTTKV